MAKKSLSFTLTQTYNSLPLVCILATPISFIQGSVTEHSIGKLTNSLSSYLWPRSTKEWQDTQVASAFIWSDTVLKENFTTQTLYNSDKWPQRNSTQM